MRLLLRLISVKGPRILRNLPDQRAPNQDWRAPERALKQTLRVIYHRHARLDPICRSIERRARKRRRSNRRRSRRLACALDRLIFRARQRLVGEHGVHYVAPEPRRQLSSQQCPVRTTRQPQRFRHERESAKGASDRPKRPLRVTSCDLPPRSRAVSPRAVARHVLGVLQQTQSDQARQQLGAVVRRRGKS